MKIGVLMNKQEALMQVNLWRSPVELQLFHQRLYNKQLSFAGSCFQNLLPQ